MVKLELIEIVGAGPAGLCAGILLKSAWPAARVRVTEQNPADATFGFGVVFSDRALDFLEHDDPATHALITPRMERWRDMTLDVLGTRVTLDGIGFAAIGRLELLQILQRRAAEVGVELRFGAAVESVDDLDADLIVGADGLNSLVRKSDEAVFAPTLDHFANHFAWFGAPVAFETLSQTFIRGPHGTLNAHHYRYAPDMSTFIVECDAAGFAAYGFADLDEADSARRCAEYFADALGGAPLVTNRSIWRQFPRLWCARWIAGNRVLLGDAAHTAHFSIGSGTRLALEDAIALAMALREERDLDAALGAYEAVRQPIAKKLVDGANTSARWYDDFAARLELPPLEFAYSYLTRSGRIDDDRLRQLAPRFSEQYASYLGSKTDPPG